MKLMMVRDNMDGNNQGSHTATVFQKGFEMPVHWCLPLAQKCDYGLAGARTNTQAMRKSQHDEMYGGMFSSYDCKHV